MVHLPFPGVSESAAFPLFDRCRHTVLDGYSRRGVRKQSNSRETPVDPNRPTGDGDRCATRRLGRVKLTKSFAQSCQCQCHMAVPVRHDPTLPLTVTVTPHRMGERGAFRSRTAFHLTLSLCPSGPPRFARFVIRSSSEVSSSFIAVTEKTPAQPT